MFFYIMDTLTDFFPLLLFILFFIFFFTGKKAHPPTSEDNGEVETESTTGDKEQSKQPQAKDLAAEFERLLGKHKREQVYTEPQLEPVLEKQVFQPRHAASTPTTKAAQTTKLRAAHPRLVQGVIMAEILGKPRGLRPYSDEQK